MANRIETSLLVKGLTADTYALDVRGKTFVDGDIEINGNVNIVGTATTINTQTVQARDNKIELNYSGSTSTAIGGGIEILSGRTDGSGVSLTIDTDRDWNSNTGFNITGRTSDATTNGLKVVNSLGTNNFVVRNDGNVGIGTSTPTEKLEVNGNIKSSQGVIVDGDTYNGIRFNGSGFSRISILNTFKFDGVFTEGFKFHNYSYDFLNYDQSGLSGDNFQISNSFIKGKNAGISDTTKYFAINVSGTPTSMLHVVGSNSSSPTALFESKATNDTAYTVRAIATTTNTQSNVGLYSYASGGFANLGLWVEEGISCFGPFNSDSKVYIKGIDSSSSNFGLKVQNGGGTNNFVVRNDGNVGIGTSTPTYKLHTMGSFIFDNGATTQNSFMVSDDEVRLWFGKTSSNYNQGILANHSFNPKGLTFIVNEGGSTGNFAMYLTEDKNVGVGFGGNSYTGVTSRMHIIGSGTTSSGYGLKVQDSSGTDNLVVRNDGNVGIGTSTPSEKLHVSGNTKITGTLNIGTIGSGSPLINLGLDSSGNVVTGTTSGSTGGGTFTGGTVTGQTIFQSGLTATTISATSLTVDYIDFNITANTTHQEGRIHWNDTLKTLEVDTENAGVQLKVGHELVVRVNNQTGSDIPKGSAVYINGEQGQRPTITLASFTADSTSASVVGLTMTQINDSSNGYVLVGGILEGLDTSSYTAGTPLYLYTGGTLTSVKPQAPDHDVRIGKVVVQNATTGSIYVQVQNGYELDELHDVRIISKTTGDLITLSAYNGNDVWVNSKTLNGSYTITGSTSINNGLFVTGNTSLQSFTGTSGNVTTNLLVPTIYGSTSSGGTLTLRSTTNTNKGFVSFPEAGTNGVKIGGLVGATTTSAIYLNVASPNDTNYSIIDTGGTLRLNSNQTDAFTDMFQVLRQGGLTVARMTMNPYGMFFAFDAVTFSNPKTFEIRVPANTGQNSGTNINNFYVQGNTKQWNTGAITNQYWNYFSQNTASFVGPSTITNSYGLFVDAAVAGTNATITNNYALGLNGGLAVSGNTILQSISANSLNITGSTRLTSLTGNSLNITGNTIISSFTGGSGTINGNLIVTGNTSMTGTLSVTGNTNVRAFTGTTGYFSGTGQNVLTVIGSGNSTSSPIFSVIGNGTGAELFSVTDSFSGSLFSVNDISGLSILDVNSDSTILMGNYLAPSLNTTTRTSLTAGTTTVYSIPTSAYTGAFFDYTLISTGSTGARAGTIMSIWSGSSAQFTESSTNDIGVTTGVTFTVAVSGNNAVLSSSATTEGWTLKTIVRSI